MDLLIRLLIAHVLTDFWLQPQQWVDGKRASGVFSRFFIFHILLTTLVAGIMTMDLALWYVPLIIGFTHFIIDWIKVRFADDGLLAFIVDQAAHVAVIFVVCQYADPTELTLGFAGFMDRPILIGGLAYLLVTLPAGYLISKATRRWQNEISTEEEGKGRGLDKAGEWIGWLERILVLTFVFLGEFGAIGFLIAAKSILRFNTTRSSGSKESEYVLIGTLTSFTIAIILGLIARYLMHL